MSRATVRKALQSVQPNLLDKAIAILSPERALRRHQSRVQLALAGAYTGASRSKRQFGDWATSAGDADADTLFDLPSLRERSRDLIRNNPLATGAINTKVVNVVGTGLALKSAIDRDFLGLSEEQAEAWQRNVEREFRMWAESPDCDAGRTLNFYGLQELSFRSVLENGDAFALPVFVDRPGVVYQLAVQLIEADRCCNEKRVADTETLAGGVEKDAAGAPKTYHFLDQHPGALRRGAKGMSWTKVPAFTQSGRRNVLHLYRQIRIGQSRGVPDLAPVISALKQLGDYTEAELTAAVVSGLFTVFIKTTDGDGPFPGLTTDVNDSGRADQQSIKMGAGAIVGLADNEAIETANPGRPNQAFDPFVQAILRQIGVALELPFEVLIMHFQSSYSAARAALLQAWKFFKARRFWLADALCRPVYEMWLTEAVAMGRISAPGFLQDPAIRHAYLGSEWVGDAPGALDPMKEAQAAALMEDRGWKTGTENTAELTGGDWEQKHRQLTRERRMRKEAGLGAQPAPAPAPIVDETEDEEGDNNGDRPTGMPQNVMEA
jgi:lambda family phage portal protein